MLAGVWPLCLYRWPRLARTLSQPYSSPVHGLGVRERGEREMEMEREGKRGEGGQFHTVCSAALVAIR